ncbi:nuclease A inhibitor family protein [Spirosoma montaniterrae]|nr:nuclease A inhibitor family protein [Spirosoma montaniterrae]
MSFTDQINPLVTGLFYPSESDEPLDAVACYLKQEELLTTSQIKDWQMLPPSVYVEEVPVADFWEPVLTEHDWYGDEEKARTAQFQQLKAVIDSQLTTQQVFRVGEYEIDVYLLGRLSTGDRAGLKTKIVET